MFYTKLNCNYCSLNKIAFKLFPKALKRGKRSIHIFKKVQVFFSLF